MPKPPVVLLDYKSAELFGPGGLQRGGELDDLAVRLGVARDAVLAESAIPALPEQLLADYGVRRHASDLGRALTTARAMADRVDRVVVFGSGCERLAVEAIFGACCHPYHNELSRSERACKPRLYFAGDAADNDHLQGLLDLLSGVLLPKQTAHSADESWAVVAIDSPGNPIEMTGLTHLLHALEASCGGNPSLAAQRFVAVAGQGSPLEKLAIERGSQVFQLPAGAGQGSCSLSAASILPAALLGLDVVALLDGAAATGEHFATIPPGKNCVLEFALVQHLFALRNPAAARRLAVDRHALLATGRWYENLVEQCLGRPCLSGLWNDAQRNPQPRKSADQVPTSHTVLMIEKNRRDLLPPLEPPGGPIGDGRQRDFPELQLAGANQLRLRQLNEAALGQFMQMMQLATAVEIQLAR